MEVEQKNLSYISRIWDLEKNILEAERFIIEQRRIWDMLLDSEQCSPEKLTVLLDKIESTEQKIKHIKNITKSMKLMLSN
jgi:hypothetical protein